jgi:hypothetical protein
MVTPVESAQTWYCWSALGARELVGAPVALNVAPWHGHLKLLPDELITHPWWVHDSENAMNVPADSCTTQMELFPQLSE